MSTFAKTAMGMFKTTAMMTGNFDWLFHCDCTGLIDLSEEDDPWSQMTRNACTRLQQSLKGHAHDCAHDCTHDRQQGARPRKLEKMYKLFQVLCNGKSNEIMPKLYYLPPYST